MNKEIKKKWVNALVSGKYKQGTNRLRTGDSYCCLGVLCDIIDSSRWDITYINNAEYFTYAGWVGYLPKDTLKLSELIGDDTHYLTRLNDELGYSFKEIANWIEENL